MTRTWGFAPIKDTAFAGAANYEQCIAVGILLLNFGCTRKKHSGREFAETPNTRNHYPHYARSATLCKPECTIVFYILTNPMYGGVHERVPVYSTTALSIRARFWSRS